MANNNKIVPKSEYVSDLMPKEMPSAWGVSPKLSEGITRMLSMQSVKHGMYASIPIVCRGSECPYAEVCPLLQMQLAPVGERCPIEIALILKGFDDYSTEFNIDQSNIVDMTIVKDLIDLDVQINRANNILAIDGSFMQDIVVTITENGDQITNPAIHKASEYKDKLLKKKHEMLTLMNSTRKDKASDKLTVVLDPSTYAAQLMSQAAAMKGKRVIDVETDDEE
jgi:predicted house-cleaning noncanonical NTP pyrophosphatase (MazG superfamily)